MKKTIINGIIIGAVAFLSPKIVEAQGTITYLSNLEQTSAGSVSVGSDSWYAAAFYTGSNVDGYVLNSIRLGMVNATGNPTGFAVMIYTAGGAGGLIFGSNLGTLNGSANPSTTGIYAYTPDSNITLSSDTYYFIMVTSGTAVADGAYEWSFAGANSYNPSDGWEMSARGSNPFWYSSNGLVWSPISDTYPQFAITATAVPEPSSLALLGLSSLLFFRHRRSIGNYKYVCGWFTR